MLWVLFIYFVGVSHISLLCNFNVCYMYVIYNPFVVLNFLVVNMYYLCIIIVLYMCCC